MYKEIASNKRKTVLFIFLFIVVIALLGWVWSEINGAGTIGLVVATVVALPSALIGYYASDKIALSVNGAKQIQKKDLPEIYNLVENLTIASGQPMPKVYIINDEGMNAFATGRDPEHASIALTAGLIKRLDKLELEGVIAHELSHIKNYDIRLGTIIVVFVGIITLLAHWMFRINLGRGRSKNNQLGLVILIIGLVLAILAPIGAKLTQLALSRKREFLADASGALLTRYPDGLASALQKITSDPKDLRHMNKATAHMYIADPTHADVNDGIKRKSTWLDRIFSTHPPVEERIKRLMEMGR